MMPSFIGLASSNGDGENFLEVGCEGDVMAEPGTLAVEEIDAILEGIKYPGGIGVVVRQPDGTFKRSSTIWALGMHSNARRSWYQARFGHRGAAERS